MRSHSILAGFILLAAAFGALATQPVLLTLAPPQKAAPAQFAQSIAHTADSRNTGNWTASGSGMVWRYTLRVPGARSMSLSATDLNLPQGGVLLIGGRPHDARDVSEGVLWSRPVAGELLVVEARIPKAESESFRLVIRAVQAGFRSLPQLQGKAAADVKNYECSKSDSNQRQSRAVVGVIVANAASCTGTLINNTRLDGDALILTAAHCAGTGAANPASAASARIYYDESTPCGSPPGEWEGAVTTMGASSVAAKDDVWLLRANSAVPDGVNPYWVGWDATDAAVGPGTFGIHHAGTLDKQFVASSHPLRKSSSGTVAGTLVNPVTTEIWEFAPTEGDIDSGASGSSLFNPQGRTVGTLSGSAVGGCGASNNGDYCAQYQRLAYSFSALRAGLDPQDDGVESLGGFPPDPPGVQLTASRTAIKPGESVTLTWSSTGAVACNASGEWLGSKPLQGSETRTLQKLGNNTFGLECNGDGGRTAKSVTVSVANAQPAPPPASLPPTSAPAAPAAPSGGGGALGLAMGLTLLILRFFRLADCRRRLHRQPCLGI